MKENPFKVQELEPIEKVCPKHGKYMAERIILTAFNTDPIVTKCPKCMEEMDAIEKKHDEIAFMRSINIPEMFLQCTLDNYNPSNEKQDFLKQVAHRFIISVAKGRNLIIAGPANSGKTHMAAAILKALHQENTRYDNIVNIIDKIKASYSSKRSYNEIRTETIKGKYFYYDFLVLDNMEQFNSTAENRKLLFSLINERYNTQKSTIVLSSLTRGELAKLISGPLLDKLERVGKFVSLYPDQYQLGV